MKIKPQRMMLAALVAISSTLSSNSIAQPITGDEILGIYHNPDRICSPDMSQLPGCLAG